MTAFTDRFGGSTLQAAQVAYRQVNLTANLVTLWPPYATADNYLARLMDVNCTVGSLTFALPDATLVGTGMDVLITNTGSQSFTVVDFAGNTIATIAPGVQRYIYLASNATQAGTWRTVAFGVGSSSPDASQLAGYGIVALNNTLNQASSVSIIGGSTTVALADRTKTFVWTGASGYFDLPALPTVPDGFFVELRNQGTGVVTVRPAGAQTIDAAASLTMNVGESCIIHGGSSAWYSVGRGRNAQFNFTQLIKTVTGGTVSLTLTEAANVVQTYNGVLLSNQVIILPGTVQVYYISNQTSGAYSLTFRSPVSGSVLVIPQGQNAVAFCDGVNVINASTTLSGVSTLLLAAGSASAPSLGISTATTGLYSSSANEVGISCNASQVAAFNTSGLLINSPATLAYSSVVSAANNAAMILDRIAGKSGSVLFRTAGVNRWELKADSDAEAGANAGSTFRLVGYDDAGAALANYLSVARATGNFTLTGALAAAGLTTSTNLAFTGTGNRITGDFSNATVASRVLLQSSTVNAMTSVESMPNGTGTSSAFAVGNTSDPANNSFGLFQAAAAEVSVQSDKRGSGSYQPLAFYSAGAKRMELATDGNVKLTGTGAFRLTAGTTAQRPTGEAAFMRLNTSLGKFEGYNGSVWGSLGGGATGAGTDAVFVENEDYVTANYTLGQGGQADCTVSIATPGVITQSNAFVGGEKVFLTTTGTLPTGLSAETAYYVSTTGLSSASYQLSATRGGAAINTSGTQSGTHKCGKIYNANVVGPLVIASGVSVRVPSGARLVVQ